MSHSYESFGSRRPELQTCGSWNNCSGVCLTVCGAFKVSAGHLLSKHDIWVTALNVCKLTEDYVIPLRVIAYLISNSTPLGVYRRMWLKMKSQKDHQRQLCCSATRLFQPAHSTVTFHYRRSRSARLNELNWAQLNKNTQVASLQMSSSSLTVRDHGSSSQTEAHPVICSRCRLLSNRDYKQMSDWVCLGHPAAQTHFPAAASCIYCINMFPVFKWRTESITDRQRTIRTSWLIRLNVRSITGW